MCGIIGIVVSPKGVTQKTKTFRKIKGIFENQQGRGVDGAGFVANNVKGWRGTVGLRYRTEDAKALFRDKTRITKLLKANNKILFHHRLPTSNENKDYNNHPIMNEKKDLTIVHNGVIGNADNLIYLLKKAGHTFETGGKGEAPNDSEVIVHLIEESLKGTKRTNKDVVKAINSLNRKANGSIAISLMVKGSDSVYLWKRDNPLEVYKDKLNNIYFSSLKPFGQGYKDAITFNTNEIVKITNTRIKVIGSTVESERMAYYVPTYSTSKYNTPRSEETCYRGTGVFKTDKDGFMYEETDYSPTEEDEGVAYNYLEDNHFWQYLKTDSLSTTTKERLWQLVGETVDHNHDYDDAVMLTDDLERFIEEIVGDAKDVYNRLKSANKTLIRNLSQLSKEKASKKTLQDNKGLWLDWANTRLKDILKSGLTKKAQTKQLVELQESLDKAKNPTPSAQTLLDVIDAREEEKGDCLTKAEIKALEQAEDDIRAEMAEQNKYRDTDYKAVRDMFG